MGNKNPNQSGLKKWQKGQSGNPQGAKKKLPDLDELLSDVLNELNPNGKTMAEMIIKSLLQQVAKGNVRAAEVLLDRAYGRAQQNIKASVDTSSEIVINTIITNDVKDKKD